MNYLIVRLLVVLDLAKYHETVSASPQLVNDFVHFFNFSVLNDVALYCALPCDEVVLYLCQKGKGPRYSPSTWCLIHPLTGRVIHNR